jgi:Protein of unknown function (DUF2384)
MTLATAIEAAEIVDALKPYGIKQRDVASVVHVTDRAVRGWRTGSIVPARYDRLAELRDLVALLSDSLTERGVGQWLHARNRTLDGERPLEVLGQGDFARVERAARAFIEGSYV